MNKIFIRGFIISVAVILLFLILFKSRSPFGKSNSSFAAEPQIEITKIEFSEGDRRLSLEKKGEKWLLNGKTETRKSAIIFIIKVLKEIKIKSTVSDDLFKTEITGKGIIPVRVKVYEKRKLLKTFLVYKTRSNTYGNIMKIKDGSNPFIVYVSDYEGNIGSAFTLNDLFWQPYTIFDLLPSQIASVNFENLSDTASSFSIFNKNNHYALSDMRKELAGWDSVIVARYLSYFKWVPFESWAFEPGEEAQNMIESRKPLYRITITTTSGRETILTLWERIIIENGTKINDSDRLIGKTQNSDELFIMRYFDIDPLLKKRSYFFPE